MLFSEITILNGRVVSKDSKAIDSFKEGDRVKIIKNESFNGRTGEFIKEYVNPKKGIIAIVDLGGIEREFPFDNLTKDSYNYNGNDYEKEDLWKLLVKEGKTKRFKELTETQQNGRTDQHALFQSNGGIYAVVRDTKDIKLNETPDSEFDAKELALGIKTEMEHTDNLQEATSIAKDHLQELPDYYSKLVKMEAKDAERIDLKCTYANGDIIRTGFNGTLQDAKDYFLNKTFNLGQGENDKMVKCIKVEQV
jgi:hypothetical protein